MISLHNGVTRLVLILMGCFAWIKIEKYMNVIVIFYKQILYVIFLPKVLLFIHPNYFMA